jgi:sugar phosphate isomerase/epimerase
VLDPLQPTVREDRKERLGIDQPVGCWPATPGLKAYEAAGFRFVQVRMPPRTLLSDTALYAAHACGLREGLALTDLRLILHAPDDLLAGTPEHDRQLVGAIHYAGLAGAELVVYHGARIPVAAADVRRRLRDEEHSLRHAVRLLPSAGVHLAIENLAPVYPGPEHVCHDPAAVSDLVHRLDSEYVGMCLDLGHAHIAAALAGCPLLELTEPVLGDVILFHVHDNFGSRSREFAPGSVEPVRLDLHLPPGAGSIPWDALAPLLVDHPAPLQLEVHPAQRPMPAALAVVVREVLGLPAPARDRYRAPAA